MSKEEKRGYLMALGIDPENPEEFSSKSGSDPQTTKGEKVSVKREGFSSEELRLLQKMPARSGGPSAWLFTKCCGPISWTRTWAIE
ncbi:hypothetical protein AKJ64_02575 [candidate division MSBL1 archaeon SCGC-AAA259E17]|uniref:Uncharacterized protein n=1 Tax=candidate division MSBL1 archaeon SCGC-AAA259E17 TaxID=1698263 RepID=A0A133UEL8_9EURY|nr:hypothetical protein AKJ64_02575 [candidate division MSBL1 archaeon SCGC-AAA259E17]